MTAARGFLATIQAEMLRKTCRAPSEVTETLAEYGADWVESRPGLKASSRNQSRIDFRRFRTVPLPSFVAAAVREHLVAHRTDAVKTDLLFVTASGRDVLDGYSQVIRRALDRLGRPDVRMHDLRHSAMTAAAEHARRVVAAIDAGTSALHAL